MKLESKDYALLQFVAANPGLSEFEIDDALSGKVSGIHHRLALLSRPLPPLPGLPYDEDTNYLACLNNGYRLTSFGQAKLQDWKIVLKKERLQFGLTMIAAVCSALTLLISLIEKVTSLLQ